MSTCQNCNHLLVGSENELVCLIEKSKPEDLHVVRFFSEHCVPCLATDSDFARLVGEFPSVKFYTVDVVDAVFATHMSRPRYTPTAVIIRKHFGQLKTVYGGNFVDLLKKCLQELLKLQKNNKATF